jgi:hypothetical protein
MDSFEIYSESSDARAFKISGIAPDPNGYRLYDAEDGKYYIVPSSWYDLYQPEVGGFYVDSGDLQPSFVSKGVFSNIYEEM